MRTKEEVFEKFREMRGRKLREYKEKLLSKVHGNCIHNVKIKVKEVGVVGLCKNPILLSKRQKPLVCNDDDFSGRCECFECKNSEELVVQNFEDILHSPSRCGEEFPKLAMLIWFLQEEDDNALGKFQKLKKHLKDIGSEILKVVRLSWLQ
jgi:hypothetical protein